MMTVDSVTVNGAPATFAFVQPTYPGDPNGQDDPDPLAHEASQNNPVGGPGNNPLPPACSPELPNTSVGADSLDGSQCPANKLVITPQAPIKDGSTFTVVVNYTGRPGVHNDGDGTTEGWFRATGGSFVTTEPVGTEDWMPLNDYPAAKPTYDFYDTVNAGKTTAANGDLVSVMQNAPDANFPAGSATYHWHSAATIASYLVEDSVGNYTFSTRLGSDGITYKEAQDSAISAAQQASNKAVMDQQQDITDFESQFNGPFPFDTDGVAVGTPPASFEEEMQTMITFAGSRASLSTLYHENMHQWWGDNVTESGYAMTFFKEGMAQLAQYMQAARNAELQPAARTRPLARPRSRQASSRSSTRTTRGPGASGQRRRRTRRHSGCSTPVRRTGGPPRPTSRSGRSSAPTGSPKSCRRSSGHLAAARSPNHSWRTRSRAGCRIRARRAGACSASSSPSGSTPLTRAAVPPSRTSPDRAWPGPASTARTAVSARTSSARLPIGLRTWSPLPDRGRRA